MSYAICLALFGGCFAYIEEVSINLNASDAVTMPNIGYIFMGYDIMYGNPLQVSGLPVDPGFKEPVFLADYTKGSTTADKRYLEPDGTSIIDCSASCSFKFGSTEMSGQKSYQESIERKATLEVAGYGAKFSASSDNKEVVESTSKYSYLYTHSDVSCCSYMAQVLSFDPPKLSDDFRAAVGSLTEEYDEDIYLRVIRYFGTHYVSEAQMGALFGQQSKVSREAWSTMVENGFNINAGASFSAFGVTASADFMSDDDKKKAEEFSSKSTEQKIYTTGAAPPSDNNPMTWIQETKSSPAPMTLKLSSLVNLLDDAYGVEVSDAVKANMQKALDEYCNHLYQENEVASCSAPGPDPDFPNPPLIRTWVDWSTNNHNGKLNTLRECSEREYVVAMSWREQNHYGLINLGFWCSDGSYYRMTGNNRGAWNGAMNCVNDTLGFREISVEEQNHYGVVNAKAFCLNEATQQISNANQNGNWRAAKSCDDSQHIVGVQTREQNHYGIVDFRFECASALLG